jgi:cytochrome c oxidase subunit 3
MATDHSLQTHDHSSDAQLWNGAKEPFKASYGKLMMWYFLLSDAFTFAAFDLCNDYDICLNLKLSDYG